MDKELKKIIDEGWEKALARMDRMDMLAKKVNRTDAEEKEYRDYLNEGMDEEDYEHDMLAAIQGGWF